MTFLFFLEKNRLRLGREALVEVYSQVDLGEGEEAWWNYVQYSTY